MRRHRLNLFPLLWLTSAVTFADPIHAIADGAYWHHDSGWVFPEKVGEFVRVGVPQDVAGSRDAIAYYARVSGEVRMVVSVEVYPADSATHAAGAANVIHSFAKGDWRVQIATQAPVSEPANVASLGAFVRDQLWDRLATG